jgi:hypothetical protein
VETQDKLIVAGITGVAVWGALGPLRRQKILRFLDQLAVAAYQQSVAHQQALALPLH